jgi:hypothetical protein
MMLRIFAQQPVSPLECKIPRDNQLAASGPASLLERAKPSKIAMHRWRGGRSWGKLHVTESCNRHHSSNASET